MSSVKNVRLVWPEDLHRLVKAHAASEGVSLAGFVEACVRAGLRAEGVLRAPEFGGVVGHVGEVLEAEPLVPARVVGRKMVRSESEPAVEPERVSRPSGGSGVLSGEYEQTESGHWRGPISKVEQAKRGGRK